jgi:hypothetical protein
MGITIRDIGKTVRVVDDGGMIDSQHAPGTVGFLDGIRRPALMGLVYEVRAWGEHKGLLCSAVELCTEPEPAKPPPPAYAKGDRVLIAVTIAADVDEDGDYKLDPRTAEAYEGHAYVRKSAIIGKLPA